MTKQRNPFGEEILTCSEQPMTGFFRDGCCNTDKNDRGSHTICAAIYRDMHRSKRVKVLTAGMCSTKIKKKRTSSDEIEKARWSVCVLRREIRDYTHSNTLQGLAACK